VDEESCREPTAAVAPPEIVTVAVPGFPRLTEALGLLSTTSKVFSPENGAALLTGTEIVLGVESFSAHCNVPEASV